MESDIKPVAAEYVSEEISGLLLKWADVLDIPSGDFGREDLRAGAAEITRLRAEVDAAGIARLKAEERAHDLEADLAITEAALAAATAERDAALASARAEGMEEAAFALFEMLECAGPPDDERQTLARRKAWDRLAEDNVRTEDEHAIVGRNGYREMARYVLAAALRKGEPG